MSQPNPYAPPTQQATGPLVAPGQPGGRSDFWREGDQLVVPRTMGVVTLPDRCVKCGEHGTQRLNKTFQWHPRWIYFFVIVSLLIYLILAMIMRKTVQLDFALCDEHAKKRTNGIMIGWGGGLLSIAVMVGGIAGDSPVLTIVGLLGMLAAIITGAVMVKTLQPMKMDDNYAWLKTELPFLNHIGGYGA